LPIRIYALAKQLKVEHKTLVDICNQIGIEGKGSALASLTDEEVVAVKGQLERSKSARPTGSGAVADRLAAGPGGQAVRREQYLPPGGVVSRKVPVLDRKLEKPPLLKKPVAPAEEAGDKAAQKPAAAEKPEKPEKPEKVGPAIKLAPIPPSPPTPAPPQPEEPPPQKPEIRLPLDAIRASRMGTKPLSEHLRRQEEKRRLDEEKRKGAGPVKEPRAPAARGPAPLPPHAIPGLPREPERERGRRGRPAPSSEEEGGILGGREHRQLKRKRAATATRRAEPGEEEEAVRPVRATLRRVKRGTASTAAPRKSNVVVELPCTVRSFSEALGVPAQRVLAELLKLGTPAIITASLDPEMAQLLAVSLGVDVDFRQPTSLEERLLGKQDELDDPAAAQPRPPVVTFLGHVDHGKTSLLDRILGLDVAAHEKGGITQHIRAYRIERNGRSITFVDTPGHEAFTAMRARGANATDIAVLVVAADDGVMPQTEEAISHARAAGVPIIVALNKIDLPGINSDRALQELAANELLPSQWGGDTEVVRTSAVTGEGIDELLETILTVAELRELKANADRPAAGICLETEVQSGRGVIAKMLVQKGTLRVGDAIVCGAAHGRVKAMYDTLQPTKKHQQAGPSIPVNLTGLDVAPGAGDRFSVMDDVSQARQIALERAAASRQRDLVGVRPHVTLETLRQRLDERQEVQTLNIILRADTRGSIEAILKEFIKLEHPEVHIKVLQRTVGGITEADVHLADASDAVILGFNVVPDEKARVLAEQLGVQIRRYDIIYQVTEDLKAALEGMLRPEKRETDLGRALVQRVFRISRVGFVAGCRVLAGVIQRDARARVIRESRVIGDYPIESLKREKDDAREVRDGFECGIKLGGFEDVKEADVLEVYKVEEIPRTF
jgi:translation initiation factor IF-2